MTERCPRCGGSFMHEHTERICMMCGYVQGQEAPPPCETKRIVTPRYDQARSYKARTTLGRSKEA